MSNALSFSSSSTTRIFPDAFSMVSFRDTTAQKQFETISCRPETEPKHSQSNINTIPAIGLGDTMCDSLRKSLYSFSSAAILLASGLASGADAFSPNSIDSASRHNVVPAQDQTQYRNRQRLEQRINGSGGSSAAAQNRNRYRHQEQQRNRSQSRSGQGGYSYGTASGGQGTGLGGSGRRMAGNGGGGRR